MDEFSHTFVVCAYKESPFCATVWFPLTQQTLPARILMAHFYTQRRNSLLGRRVWSAALYQR